MKDVMMFDEYVDKYLNERPDNSRQDWSMEYIGYINAVIEQERKHDCRSCEYDVYEDYDR